MALSRALLVLVCLVTTLAPARAAQGGYTRERFPELGVDLDRPRDYEAIPTQPDEQFVALYFAEKLDPDPAKRRSARPELSVVDIAFVPDPPPPEPEPVPPPAPEEDEEGRSKAKPVEREKEAPPPPPVSTLERWFERHTGWDLGRSQPGKPRNGWTSTIYTLTLRRPGGAKLTGWCYAYRQEGKRTVAFVATCAPSDFEEQEKIWRHMAERADLSEPEGQDLTKLQQKYARSGLRGVDYRIEVRRKMVRGWKAEDTENFIVLYHTNDQPLIRTLLADIESIRKEYIKLFPPAGEITAVSTVRVCRDRTEYMAYGGPPGSAGYWNYAAEELVFYDAQVKEKGKRSSGDANTFIVLYHEAFHQYIHYSAGEVPPHSWFNEGHGDYFSGADVVGSKVRKIGVNPWRFGTIQRAVNEAKFVPWKEILRFEQPEYYRGDRVGLCYAQGWSMVYFLRQSPVVAKHPQWSKVLDTYFNELKADYARNLALLETQGRKDDRRAKAEVGVASRKYALEKAFDGVDIAALESAWADFISQLEFKR